MFIIYYTKIVTLTELKYKKRRTEHSDSPSGICPSLWMCPNFSSKMAERSRAVCVCVCVVRNSTVVCWRVLKSFFRIQSICFRSAPFSFGLSCSITLDFSDSHASIDATLALIIRRKVPFWLLAIFFFSLLYFVFPASIILLLSLYFFSFCISLYTFLPPPPTPPPPLSLTPSPRV